MHRAVFFDRDNTLIVNDGDLGDPGEVKLMRGAAAAVASLRGLGYRIIVVTNQGGVARGRFGEEEVEAVHDRIADLLLAQTNGAVIDGFYYCPYHPEGTVPRYRREHPWRKPQPGMLLQAAEDLGLDLSMSWMIGDSIRDVEAGHRAGVRTVMVTERTKPAEQGQLPLDPESRPDFTAQTLVEAARIVAQQMHPEPDHAAARKPQPPAPDPERPADQPTREAATDEQASEPAAPRGRTYPATERLESTQPTRAAPPQAPRPFKPWAIQPRTPEDERRGETRPPRAAAEPHEPHEPPAPPDEAAGPSAPPEPADRDADEADQPAARPVAQPPKPTQPIRPKPPADVDADRSPAAAAPAAETATAPPLEPHEPPHAQDVVDSDARSIEDDVDDAGPAKPGDQARLLRQILRELRYRRAHESDWSLAKVFGLGIAQPLAAFCALMGVINFDQAPTLVAWLLGAAVAQLLVLTLLVLHWQR